jgi:hypothetical protein
MRGCWEAPLNDSLLLLEARIVNYGLFLIFLFKFGNYVAQEIWHIVRPLFRRE